MSILTLDHVSKKYGKGEQEFYALKDASFSLEEGKLVVILGPSGAGKSTLLNLIGGLDNPTSGTIKVNGEDISTYNQNQLATYRAETVGFIFQFYNLIPTLTAYENVALVKEICKNYLDPAEILEQVGLKEHLHSFPSELSGGEQQRVSIARALCKNPKVILCDEPTGALDSKTGTLILKLLNDMTKTYHKSVLIVTHNSSIASIADVIIRVKNGMIRSVEENLQIKSIDEVEW